MSDHHAGWILLEEFCQKYGQRANTLQKRVHDGHWSRGEIYSCPSGGRTFIHEEKAVDWMKKHGKL